MIHPITGNRARFVMWWLVWLLTATVHSLILYFLSGIGLWPSILDGFISSAIFSLLAIAIWYPTFLLRDSNSQVVLIIANHAALLIVTVILWAFSTRFIVETIVSDPDGYTLFWKDSFLLRAGAGSFIYLVVIMSYWLMISMDRIAQKNLRETRLENMLRETELLMLRSQINPHFLFNSLNSISSLTLTNPSKAREMVIKLSDFMRYALSRKEDKTVPLGTELQNLRLYLEIEKIRFGDKLVMKEELSGDFEEVKIPNMILQPLYENAIKHGVYESTGEVVIELQCQAEEDHINIVLRNNYDPEGIPSTGTGTGLQNIRRRLELNYGGNASLITTKKEGIFTAQMIIPSNQENEN